MVTLCILPLNQMIINWCQILAFLTKNRKLTTGLLALLSLRTMLPRHVRIVIIKCPIHSSHALWRPLCGLHNFEYGWCTRTDVTYQQFGCEHGARNKLSQEHRWPPMEVYCGHRVPYFATVKDPNPDSTKDSTLVAQQ